MARAFVRTGGALLFVIASVAPVGAEVCVDPPAGLVGWWPADGDGRDLVGGNDGALIGGATFAPGKVGQAFALNGVDAFVDAGNAASLHVTAGDFTVEAWVSFNSLTHPPGANRSDAPPGDVSIVDKMSTRGVNVDGWRLLKQADNRFWFCLGGGIGNRCQELGYTLFSTTVATTGVWYHLAAVKSAAALSLYVNGQLQDSRSPVPEFMDLNAGDLLFGANALQGGRLNGLIDEVALYDRALPATEIQAVFLAGPGGKCKATTVVIDVKPDGFPNSVNPRSRGVIPVAIRTTSTFDALTVNPFTVRFGRTGTEAAPAHVGLAGVDRDHETDLILHFETQQTGLECGDSSAALTGQTWSGHAIRGSDSILTVGCGRP
jgi:Concanavalin A-like lectin/glucanases superfamily